MKKILDEEKLDILEDSKRSKSSKSKKIESKKIEVMQDTEQEIVQRKILLFFGKLNSDLHDLLVSNADEMSKISTALDLNRKLSYEVPFPDIRPTIFLDDFLPRIFDLSLDSKDRRTRMAACEVLHVMIIYIIGKK